LAVKPPVKSVTKKPAIIPSKLPIVDKAIQPNQNFHSPVFGIAKLEELFIDLWEKI
jgi:hypothetical protein